MVHISPKEKVARFKLFHYWRLKSYVTGYVYIDTLVRAQSILLDSYKNSKHLADVFWEQDIILIIKQAPPFNLAALPTNFLNRWWLKMPAWIFGLHTRQKQIV